MSGNVMMFPDTVEEFMEQNKVVDREQVYSNGIEFVPIFRMQQWFDHVKHSPDDVLGEGKWNWTVEGDEDYEQFWVCSRCGAKMYFATNYCPNCGAKMEVSDDA